MVRLGVDVSRCVVRFSVRLVAATCEVEGNVKEVDRSLVCADRDFQPGVSEELRDGFAGGVCLVSRHVLEYCEAIVAV